MHDDRWAIADVLIESKRSNVEQSEDKLLFVKASVKVSEVSLRKARQSTCSMFQNSRCHGLEKRHAAYSMLLGLVRKYMEDHKAAVRKALR
jgi:hypothetical protein